MGFILKFGIPLLITLAASVAGGIFYRMGGSGHYSRAMRIALTTMMIALMLYIKHHDWSIFPWVLLSWGLMSGAISSYWTMFSKPDPSDNSNSEWWLNYLLHDLGVVLGTLPYVIVTARWIPFIPTILIAPVIVAVYSQVETKAVREELVRGGLIVLTLGLL